MLTLVRANKSRASGHWSDDDYDVRDVGNRVIGRIMLHPQAPKDQPWLWTKQRERQNRRSTIRVTRQAASKRWQISRRGD
jgi:hypothetical protein